MANRFMKRKKDKSGFGGYEKLVCGYQQSFWIPLLCLGYGWCWVL